MSAPDPIVHAAVLRFAREGFDAPLRGIAADAGVSAALIMKRFGSKDRLRAAADERVLAWMREARQQHAAEAGSGQLLASLATRDEYAPLVVYVMHAILAASDLGREVVEQLIEDAEIQATQAVADGTLQPSRDETARSRYLTLSTLGAFLLSVLLRSQDDEDLSTVSRRHIEESLVPALELYREGTLATRAPLEGRSDTTGADTRAPNPS